ncbi:MAG: HD domain-containing protein [Lachnospiraceae bacterium]|nr:HD domain-containing protein [Lachnospiraceae bacterium]
MTINLPESVKKIIAILKQAGYDAYAVGGCVRDSLLDREPDDWDITTSALPEQVKQLFKRTIDTGIKHGTVTVLMKPDSMKAYARQHVKEHIKEQNAKELSSPAWETYEVTTYRIDGEYEDSRHPKEVSFTDNLMEDLKRRDFTINAMAFNEEAGIVDAFSGMEDLKKGIIRAVGNPEERFTEDALRMMRAVRFAAQLGYEIEEETKKAIKKLAYTLKNISGERIQTELVKLVMSNHPEQMRLLYTTGVTGIIMPEFDLAMETEQNHPHHCYSVGEHIIHSMEAVDNQKVLRLTMLFHDIGKPLKHTVEADGYDHFHGHAEKSADIARDILKRLKFDNDTIDRVTRLVLYHDYKIEPEKKYVRRAIHKIGEDIFPDYLQVQRADIAAQSDYMRKEKLERLEAVERLYEEIIRNQECVSLKTLALKGDDLMEEGIKPGREMGIILKEMLELVLEDNTRNNRKFLLEYLKNRNN